MSIADLERDLGLPAGTAQPCSWRNALYRPEAPGARLDGQPWARSWPAYLRSVFDPEDASARTFIANAMSERIPAEGGFLVPEILRSQVFSYMPSAAVRPRATVLPMSSLRLPVPTLENPSQASGNQVLGGLTFAQVEEGAAIPASNPNFGRIVLEARKFAAYLQNVPNELVNDGAGAFGDFLAKVIAKGYAWFEDDQFIYNGTGAGQPASIFNAGCAIAVTRTTSSTVVYADIVTMHKKLHPASKAAASTAWLVSNSAYDQLADLFYPAVVASTTTPITPPMLIMGGADGKGPTLAGIDLIVTDHQPALGTEGDVILADLSNYLIGDRMELTVERSQQGPGFIYDTSNFRIRSRVDGQYWIQTATTTEAGQNVSPVIVLN